VATVPQRSLGNVLVRHGVAHPPRPAAPVGRSGGQVRPRLD